MWSREEEFFYDTFRPAAIVKINSGVDDAGKMAFWDYDVYFAGERGAPQFYTIPNHRTASRGSGFGGPARRIPSPPAPGARRATTPTPSPGNRTWTCWPAAAGMDPVEFRLKNLNDPRMIRVLKAAADKFGWTPAKSPEQARPGRRLRH